MDESSVELELSVEGEQIDADEFAQFLAILCVSSTEIISDELSRAGADRKAKLTIRSLRPGSIIAFFGVICLSIVAIEDTRTAAISLIRRLIAAGHALVGVSEGKEPKDRDADMLAQSAAKLIAMGGASRIEFHVHGDNNNFFVMDREQATLIRRTTNSQRGGAIGDVDSEVFEDGALRSQVLLRYVGGTRWEALIDGAWVQATGIDAYPLPSNRDRRAVGTVLYRAENPDIPFAFQVMQVSSH